MKRNIAARRALLFLVLLGFAGNLVLSLMRDAKGDETMYLRDSAVMADCLRAGRWFGNEGVGVHGFIFKLPAALLFLAIGKSVYAATLVNVFLAAAACLLCFRLLSRLLESEGWALGGTWLLAANFQFLRLSPTYNRDIPALFAVLLLLNAVVDRRGRWQLGLILLLILDAKEYLYFILLPPFLIWSMFDAAGAIPKARRFRALQWIRLVLARWTAALLPAAVYLVLMFCTSVVPLNMFSARILCLTEPAGADTLVDQFRPEAATRNPWPRPGQPRSPVLAPAHEPSPPSGEPDPGPWPLIRRHAPKYLAKLFYPGVFSFDGIPKAMALPAVVMSLLLFFRRGPNPNRRRFLVLASWAFLASFMAMPSYPRYLLPIYPVLFMFLILFLLDTGLGFRIRVAVFAAACCFVAGGLYFSRIGLIKKIGVNLVMLAALAAVLFRAETPRRRERYAALFVLLAGSFSILAAVRYTCFNYWGQAGNFLKYGPNRECREVMAQFGETESFWVNDAGWKYLADFHLGQRPATAEWEGRLKPWVPKKRLLIRHEDRRGYDFCWRDIEEFRSGLRRHRIEYVGLVVSLVQGDPFQFQWWRDDFDHATWLSIERSVPLKNKMLRIYSYIPEEHLPAPGETNPQ